jgi:NAD(P)-dependent dehydrogenase (short-subunit alcohol dehydrogenase family)
MNFLANQAVLVIGGSSGIGFGVAKAVHQEGARVIIASSSQSKVDGAVQRLGGASDVLSGATIDVKTEAGVRSFFEIHGAVDHVVYTVSSTSHERSCDERFSCSCFRPETTFSVRNDSLV